MKKNPSKKLKAILFIAVVWVCALALIGAAVAEGSLNTGIDGLSATYDDGAWDISGTTITGSLTTPSAGCEGMFSDATATLTFTNESGFDAILTYTVAQTGGTGSVTDDGNGSVSLAEGESTTIVISVTGGNVEDTTSITITDLSFTVVRTVSVTFGASANGSYTVNGTSITTETTMTDDSSVSYTLSASPAAGYQFQGWYDATNDTYFSLNSTYTGYFTDDVTVYPLFVPDSTPLFAVNGQPFADLNDAITYAQSGGYEQITLYADGTIYGNYAIPSGITLLIPCDSAFSCYKENPAVLYNVYETPSSYKTLTMATGASITIENGGAISVSAPMATKGQMNGHNGMPSGPCGYIHMNSGSNITVENGANLYAWGFIYGSGGVTAESGSTVYEMFQVKDWRGGGAGVNAASAGVFPMNQYYVQNIEVPMTMYAGAAENLVAAINASGMAFSASAYFIGSQGMFNIQTGYLVKDYDEDRDRLNVDVYGDMSFAPLTLGGLPAQIGGSLSTSMFTLPITSNITINLHSGTTSLSQTIELFPGVEITVDHGVTFEVTSGRYVYAYDRDDWMAGKYTGTAHMYALDYTAAHGAGTRRTEADLQDVLIDVNGEIRVQDYMLTSLAGANITSSEGTGYIYFESAAPTGTVDLAEFDNNSTKKNVKFTAAKLHNHDGSYMATAGSIAGNNFRWVSDFNGGTWMPETCTITYEANGGSGTMADTIIDRDANLIPGVKVTVAENGFTRTGYKFKEWNTMPAGTGTAYQPGDEVLFYDANTIFYAQWLKTGVTIKWVVNGETIEEVYDQGDIPVYKVNDVPALPAVDEYGYTYTFLGWATSQSAADAGTVAYGPEDALPAVGTAARTYYAVFDKIENTHTVTFHANGGSGTMDPQTIGEVTQATLTPNAFTAPAEHVFVFWNTKEDATGDIYTDGQSTTLAADIDLYAIWARTYTVDLTAIKDGDDGNPEIAKTILNYLPGETSLSAPAYTYYDITAYEYNGTKYDTLAKARNAMDAYLAANSNSGRQTIYIHYTRQTFSVTIWANLEGVEGNIKAYGKTSYGVGKSVILTAPESLDYGETTYYFDHWVIDGQTYTMLSSSFMSAKTAHYDAVAYYLASEADVQEPSASYRITNVYPEQTGSKYYITESLEFTLPDDAILLQVGYIYTTSTNDLYLNEGPGGTRWTRRTSVKLVDEGCLTGTYTLHVKVSKTTTPLKICAYLSYEDGDGSLHDIYFTHDGKQCEYIDDELVAGTDGCDKTNCYETLTWAGLQ